MGYSWNTARPGIAASPGGAQGRGTAWAPAANPVQDEPATIVRSFVLENDAALIQGVIDQLMAVAARLRLFPDAIAQRVNLALHEAMLNGIHHGNLELDSALKQEDEGSYHRLAARRRRMQRFRDRRLHVGAMFNADMAVFVIGDDGHGFDPTRLPDADDPACFERPSGRGLILIRAFMDEVTFNVKGNVITLVKRRHAEHRGETSGLPERSVANRPH